MSRLPRLSCVGAALIWAGLSLTGLCCAAHAQVEDRPGVTTYPAAYFSDNQPNTASDMIKLVPGFRLQEGNANLRGYSGSAGNILIDGQRPTSKEEALDDILKRMSASAVARIELIRSGAAGFDMQGFAVMANIVRAQSAKITGRVEVEDALFHRSGRSAPRLAGQVTYTGDGRTLDLSGMFYREVDGQHGMGSRDRFAPGGGVLRLADFDQPELREITQFAAEYRQGLLGGDLRFNTLIRQQFQFSNIAEHIRAPAVAESSGSERERIRAGEVQLEYTLPLNGGDQVQLFAIHRATDTQAAKKADTAIGFDITRAKSGERESILRGAYRLQRGALTWESGIEGAINILNSHSDLEQGGIAIALPAANVRVEEQRAEAFTSATWRFGPGLTTELGTRYETSRLQQSGDSSLIKALSFMKPRLLTTWSPAPNHQLRFLVERQVGQLNFDNFVSSASLSNNNVTAGNKNLEPDRTVRFELTWERRFWERASLTLTARRDFIKAVVDHVPVFSAGGVFDANGNIGNGRRDELQASLILPLDHLGLTGVTVQGEGVLRHTLVTDPATGVRRRFSNSRPLTGQIGVTYDQPEHGLRWSVNFQPSQQDDFFKIDEIWRVHYPSRLQASVDYKPSPEWTLRLFGRNLLANRIVRERSIYGGLRGVVPLSYVERRTLSNGSYFGFNVQRTFGG